MKYKLTLLFIAILFLGTVQETKAQDARFAQFYNAPSQLNPAMTGVFEGRWRVHANYRDQWASVLDDNPYRTFAAGVDARFRIVGDDFLAVGLSANHDNMVGQSQFNNSRGQFSVAYLKQLSGDKYRTSDQYLIAGGQAGMGQHRMNGSRLWFSEQFDVSTGRPDFGASSGETGDVLDSQSTDLFMDFSAGLLWYALFGDNASIYAGAALHHLNEPEISFFAFGEETLYRRWTAHIGGEVPFSPELSLLPAIAVIGQGPSRSTSVGANIRYSNNDWYEVAIRAGVWTHFARQGESDSHMDALTFTGILEMENWNLGLSYDINTSNLNLATNSRGAFEMSLIYIYPYEGRTKVNCPKF